MSPTTLIEPLRQRRRTDPQQTAVVFIGNDGSQLNLTVAELVDRAEQYGRCLRARLQGASDVAIIALPHCIELLYAFWGAQSCGIVPSMFPFPFPSPSLAVLKRQIRDTVHCSDAKIVLTTPKLKPEIEPLFEPGQCTVVALDEIESNTQSPPLTPTAGDQLAYLQFTSGTSGLQKGVALSHRAIGNLVQNLGTVWRITAKDKFINWTPLYHDGGLFAAMVAPIVLGIPTILMSHLKWIRRPVAFLKLIEQFGATLSWMPNSALNHTVSIARTADLEGLNLSSLRILLGSGEPVRYESQQAFLEMFAPYGLKEEALITGYGMAENTLAVTLCEPGRRAPFDVIDAAASDGQRVVSLENRSRDCKSITYVSCGRAVPGTELQIVDDQGAQVGQRTVGEVAFRGNTLFNGYYRDVDLTNRSIRRMAPVGRSGLHGR